ncbi:MAG TPA: hypothetical protein VHC42_12020 [Rhizomicrobium sp.]|jgi:hypothetical protein|nr:hypothetical protein [Rhizomicrobium sp.]HWA70013.1 hypothetical protein [Rhizomicrobium sp.]
MSPVIFHTWVPLAGAFSGKTREDGVAFDKAGNARLNKKPAGINAGESFVKMRPPPLTARIAP